MWKISSQDQQPPPELIVLISLKYESNSILLFLIREKPILWSSFFLIIKWIKRNKTTTSSFVRPQSGLLSFPKTLYLTALSLSLLKFLLFFDKMGSFCLGRREVKTLAPKMLSLFPPTYNSNRKSKLLLQTSKAQYFRN